MTTDTNEPIKIEKGIPIPKLNEKNGVAEALRKMEVGDSFVHPEVKRNNIHAVARYIGIKVTTRRQPDGTYRIWRKA